MPTLLKVCLACHRLSLCRKKDEEDERDPETIRKDLERLELIKKKRWVPQGMGIVWCSVGSRLVRHVGNCVVHGVPCWALLAAWCMAALLLEPPVVWIVRVVMACWIMPCLQQ